MASPPYDGFNPPQFFRAPITYRQQPVPPLYRPGVRHEFRVFELERFEAERGLAHYRERGQE